MSDENEDELLIADLREVPLADLGDIEGTALEATLARLRAEAEDPDSEQAVSGFASAI